MTQRPLLRPHLHPVRRGDAALQFSADPGPAGLVISGLSQPEVELVLSLDGTRDLRRLDAAAASAGIPAVRWREVLAVLDGQGLLAPSAAAHTDRRPHRAGATSDLALDAHAFDQLSLQADGGRVAQRAAWQVLIDGTGSLPAATAAVLRSGGVGTVHCGATVAAHCDLGLRPDRHRGGEPATAPPDLVVLVGLGALDPARADPWQQRGVPHLPVVAQPHRIDVGPVMGLGGTGACVRCQHLLRTDRDAWWPHVAAQVVGGQLRRPPAVGAESSITQMAAGAVAMIVFTVLAGIPVPDGVALEVALPWPQIGYRRWSRHPACPAHGCSTADPSTDQPPAGPVRGTSYRTRPAATGATMAG
jgi:hypothetical protein